MIEVQHHGFAFERWVKEQVYGPQGSVTEPIGYTADWDIPATHTNLPHIPEPWRGLPVSIKTCCNKSPIGLGDALRQRQINQPFVMIVGFWRQQGLYKYFDDMAAVLVTQPLWQQLWGPLTLSHLQTLDSGIKNRSLTPQQARHFADDWNASHTTERALATLVINRKIDSKTQRRVQCSLPYKAFWAAAGRPFTPQAAPTLFGVAFKNPVLSGVRTFGQQR